MGHLERQGAVTFKATRDKGPTGNSQVSVRTKRQREYSEKRLRTVERDLLVAEVRGGFSGPHGNEALEGDGW